MSIMRRALTSGGSSGAHSGRDLGHGPVWESNKGCRPCPRKTLYLSRFHLQCQPFLEPQDLSVDPRAEGGSSEA